MTADDFIREFELLADAPNGVQKLREMVLQLAVQGKLVPQMLEEPSARKCLAESCSGITDIALQDDETLPVGWEALSLGCLIATNTGGGTPSKQRPTYWGGAIPWASVKDIKEEKYLTGTIDTITEEGLENSSSNLIPAGRLIVVTRMGLGKLAINKIDVAINQDLRALEPIDALDIDFAYILFKTLKLVGKGVTVKGITVKALHAVLVSLPPLAEQKRIVAKVDELMRLCDELEERQARKNESRVTLNASCLNALLDIKDGRPANSNTQASKRTCHADSSRRNNSTTEAAQRRIFDHFDILYDNPENVAQLRKAILQLAVQGRLGTHNVADEEAAVLLQRIAKEKARLVENGLIKKAKKTPVLDASCLPTIPRSWLWIRMGMVLHGSEAGWSPACEKRPRVGSEWGVLKVSAVTWGEFRADENKALPHGLVPREELAVSHGDFLITRANTLELVARSVIVPCDHPRLLLSDKIVRLFFSPKVDARFFNLANNSSLSRRYYSGIASGTSSSMRNVSRQSIMELPVPLPPLAEQKRIVAKVDELMQLCDRVELTLKQSRADSEKLMASVINHLTKPAR